MRFNTAPNLTWCIKNPHILSATKAKVPRISPSMIAVTTYFIIKTRSIRTKCWSKMKWVESGCIKEREMVKMLIKHIGGWRLSRSFINLISNQKIIKWNIISDRKYKIWKWPRGWSRRRHRRIWRRILLWKEPWRLWRPEILVSLKSWILSRKSLRLSWKIILNPMNSEKIWKKDIKTRHLRVSWA